MRGFLGDLFKGVGNNGWELARILSTLAIASVLLMGWLKEYRGQDLSLTEYANALMAVFGGCALFIGSKDLASAHACAKRAEVPLQGGEE